jgi:hypothetical protein
LNDAFSFGVHGLAPAALSVSLETGKCALIGYEGGLLLSPDCLMVRRDGDNVNDS